MTADSGKDVSHVEVPRKTSTNTVSIIGTGSYLPERILTNADLVKMVNTTEEWIETRTGILERRIARDDQATSDLGAEAARRALADAGVAPEEVDMIIVATMTPDIPFPNTACLIQKSIGAVNAFCFSMEAACTGFVYALEIGNQFVSSGRVKTALVVGAEKMSSVLDWHDRSTCVLFGDGAGAAVLQARGAKHGIMPSIFGSDGALSDLLMIPAGGSRMPASTHTVANRQHYLKMSGKEVYRHAVTKVTHATETALRQCSLTIDDIACIIPHQANVRIIEAIADRLNAPIEKFFINVHKYGNTSGASSIIAMDDAAHSKRIKRGDIVLYLGFGGGFTWGAGLLEWYK